MYLKEPAKKSPGESCPVIHERFPMYSKDVNFNHGNLGAVSRRAETPNIGKLDRSAGIGLRTPHGQRFLDPEPAPAYTELSSLPRAYLTMRVRDGHNQWTEDYFVPLVRSRGVWWLDLGRMFTGNLERVMAGADFVCQVSGNWMRPYQHKILVDRL